MEFQEDSSDLLYAEAEENFVIDNPDSIPAEAGAEIKEGDSLLVDMVRQYPLLYDKSVSGYKNTELRANCWSVIARVMNMEPNDCLKRWGQLRESFSREKRKRAEEARSGSGLSKRRGFSLYSDMRFLEAHTQTRRTFTNVSARCISAPPRPTIFPGFLSSTMMMPVQPLCTPTSCNQIWTQPVSVTSLPSTPEISEPEPLNTGAPSPLPVAETLITGDIGSTPSLTLPPGLLTPPPSSSVPTPIPTPTPSPDPFISSSSSSSTCVYSAPSPSYRFSPSPSHRFSPSPSHRCSPSPPYYPRAALSAVPYTSSVPKPSASSGLNSNFISQPRRTDSISSRYFSTSQPLPRSRTPLTLRNDDIEENLPSSVPHKVSQPTGCFNKDLVRTKKLDPVETAFLGVSAALQNHLTNSVCKETETKIVPSDDAFANLIAAELKNLDESARAAKKIRLMQVLYDPE